MSDENTPQTRLVLYPCPHHLKRGRTYQMGDALGDIYWEHPNGNRERIATCRECAAGYAPWRDDSTDTR